jgi:molybdopterin synthase catalytic subunit
MNRFALSRDPIDTAECQAALNDAGSGACATFEGWVRDHNLGRPVVRLEYEAYEALALTEGEAIIGEAIERFEISGATCVHRLGALEIGDMAVWVGVAAGHRDPAFAACRYIIDEIKQRVPIWKKEFYPEGDTGWINSEPPRE